MVFASVPKGAEHLGIVAAIEDILGELADVEVVGNQIVGGVNLAAAQFAAQLVAALPAGDVFAPGFGW